MVINEGKETNFIDGENSLLVVIDGGNFRWIKLIHTLVYIYETERRGRTRPTHNIEQIEIRFLKRKRVYTIKREILKIYSL